MSTPFFAPSYFAPSYFPSGYFTPGSLLIADDLVDAVVALVQAQLVETGALTWFGTGQNPDETLYPLPYAAMAEPDEDDTYWTTSGDQLCDGHLQIDCYAATKKAARKLGDQVASALSDAPLVFAAGILVYLRQVSRTASLDPDPAPGGGDCWAETRLFNFKYSTNLNA